MGGGRRRGNAAGRRNDRGKKIGQGELFQRWDDGAGGDERVFPNLEAHDLRFLSGGEAVVRTAGIEPAREVPRDFKSLASTSFAIAA